MKFAIGIVTFCVAAMLAASLVTAEEAAVVDVTGIVTIAKDDAGAVTGITMKSATEVVTVKVDDISKKMIEVDAQNVKATGTVETKDGKKTLTVQKFAAVPAEKKAE